MTKNVAFRVDASVDIGTGHVMRCLTLADMLTEHGYKCRFICRRNAGDMVDTIAKRGFRVETLGSNVNEFYGSKVEGYASWLGVDQKTDAFETISKLGDEKFEWIIVDHYAIDYIWERDLRKISKNLMVIDDLANRKHDCTLLLDQNLGRLKCDYNWLIEKNTELLIGPEFALLRPEFALVRDESLKRRVFNKINRILITFGGTDSLNLSVKILDALDEVSTRSVLEIDVLLGSNAPWASAVINFSKKMKKKCNVIIDAKNVSELMMRADLCIGSAGSTSWERCALGLPAVLVCVADNQRMVISEICKRNAAIEISLEELLLNGKNVIEDALNSVSVNLKQMVDNAASVTNGLGSLKVVSRMLKI